MNIYPLVGRTADMNIRQAKKEANPPNTRKKVEDLRANKAGEGNG